MKENYTSFLKEAYGMVPKDRIYTDALRTLCWGTDAGFYRLTPQIVIRSDNENEVSSLLALASRHGLPVTFRAAGTSLSGQAISDSILIVAGKHWERYRVSDDHASITLQPGIVGARVNAILKPFNRRFGPDPASIGSCMVGGIVMNNASGMSCGTHANSDKTLISARIILADGTVLDTGSEESRAAFKATHGDFIRNIEALRDEVRADKGLSDRISYKYSIKNVTGLNILPFVAYDDPFDIIAHLMVGSEGTLGFLSEVTMQTFPIPEYKASAMIYFRDITTAASAVVAMRSADINAAELFDRRSLTAMTDSLPEEIRAQLDKCDLTAVLTEVTGDTEETLQANINAATATLASFETVTPVLFQTDQAICAEYWKIRSGIFPAVGGLREEGTTCLIEDVAFHIEDLPQATADLSALLDRHGYKDSCIYGHALEGNFHFIINQSFNTAEDIARYKAMILDVVEMVVNRYDGSLKAEHGTGRNMAPFVRLEWGDKAYDLMCRIKALFDPAGILNPGVIFNDDPDCYIKDLKALPVLDTSFERINKCIECGFCEVNCLTCGETLSSRTRIVANREMTHLAQTGSNPALLAELKKQYLYLGNRSCAGDGLCSTSCPMGINVGDLTHEIRASRTPKSSIGYKAGDFAANHFEGMKSTVRSVLRTASLGQAVLGTKAMSSLCKGLHTALGVPLWVPSMPEAYNIPDGLDKSTGAPLKVVYFPSCLNQMMGLPKEHPAGRKPLAEEMASLLHKAGYDIIFPEGMERMCCGTIWESKGLPDIADRKTAELENALWEASEHGKYPVLCDQSPCLHRMKEKITSMELYEPAEFIWKYLRDRLDFHPSNTPVALHLTCSMRKMHKDNIIIELARLCSDNVFIPEEVGCCGFAGDKGMTNPEINAYALRKLRPQIEARHIETGYSNSRTCEIGLATNSGIPYISIAYLVNEHTTPKY